jgi:low temperature requirement protein LtrA
VATIRLIRAKPGTEQSRIARDSYSYLHLPMVAGIVLTALGMKKVLGDFGDPLKVEIATALMGGVAMYLLAHVLFRWRNIHTLNRQRLFCAFLVLALIPVATEIDSLASLAILVAVLVILIAYETIRFAELRDRIRHEIAREGVAAYAER